MNAARRGPNRRQLPKAAASASIPIAMAHATFAQDGSDWLVTVQLNDFAVVRTTFVPADLMGWSLIRFTSGNAFGAIFPIALEAADPTAEGSRFTLRFEEDPGDVGGTWKLLVPTVSDRIVGRSGGHLGGAGDDQTPYVPAGGQNSFSILANFGEVGGAQMVISDASVTDITHVGVTLTDGLLDPLAAGPALALITCAGAACTGFLDGGGGTFILTFPSVIAGNSLVVPEWTDAVRGPLGEWLAPTERPVSP